MFENGATTILKKNLVTSALETLIKQKVMKYSVLRNVDYAYHEYNKHIRNRQFNSKWMIHVPLGVPKNIYFGNA